MSRIDRPALAVFFARWVLGLIFAMAGYWKTFELGPSAHAEGMFVGAFAQTWIPVWLLWVLGTSIPVIELVAGVLMCVGWRVKQAGVALGLVLVAVTYGHLLQEPLFDTTHHIFPRLVLLVFVLMVAAETDTLSIDARLAGRKSAEG